MTRGTIWKGYIHFGDTDVPVKLHAAIKEERIQFHLLHRSDHEKLHQQMICANEKTPVPPEAQIKGFEVEEGKYIIVDPAEMEQTTPESSRMIEVHEFVKTEQIDPIFLDRVYYLAPDSDISASGYSELVGALRETGVEGICTWTMRKRSYLGALKASGKILRLNTLRYADEVISIKALELQEIPVSEKELKIGSDLINQLTVPFQPQKFENEHQKRLQKLIEKKAHGEKVVLLRPRILQPTASDQLLQVLEASLKKAA
ncbi:MAG: Ku protein [Desulfuromonadaceae bacterium]|nr:Ku protein [Desulfuromonadaceae bacterium]